VGELGTIRRYLYWSDRRVKSIAAANNIEVNNRWRLVLRSPTFAFLPQAEATMERRTVQLHEVALRVERAIGQRAVQDFVTSPPAAFAKGCGRVTFAEYTPWHVKKGEKRQAVVIHTRTKSTSGQRIEVCLFASIENCAGYLSGSGTQAPMWSSSSTPFIEEFIANKGRQKAKLYDDDESIAVEILRVFNNEGMTDKFVFNCNTSTEWFAEVYHDVELDKERWNLKPGVDLPEPVDRIVIGAPLWVRSGCNLQDTMER
jgi:hypothetical protein